MEFLLTLAIAVLFVMVIDQRQKLRRLEQRLGALSSLTHPPEREAGGKAAADDAQAVGVAEPLSEPKRVDAAPLGLPDDSVLDGLRTAYGRMTAQTQRAPAVAVAAAAASAGAITQSPPVAPAPDTQTPEKRGFSFSFEDIFGRQLPIWAGGITLAVAGVLIVKYAIDAGLLTPSARIMGGLLFGTGLIAGAEAIYRKEELVKDPRVRQALSGAGIATLYATILMAHNGYGLIGPIAAFLAMAVITAAALGLSLRFGAPSALLGLTGGLATPALVGSMQPNVPLLAAYLALTIGGLAAISRRQKWMWMGLTALVGGGVWSLILIATSELDPLNSVALGGLVMILAIALPLLGFDGPRQAIMRVAAAAVGAAQLALLVASGGFTPLHWSLFIMIALAIQWLARHFPQDRRAFALAQATSLILSVLLLLVWPGATPVGLFIVGSLLLLIHAVPLFPRVWSDEPDWPAAQWAGMGLAIGAVGWKATGFSFEHPNFPLALTSLAVMLFTLIPVLTGWAGLRAASNAKQSGARLALLAAVAGWSALIAAYCAWPLWAVPVAAAVIAVALLELANRTDDGSAAWVAVGYAIAALLLLSFDLQAGEEFARLSGENAAVPATALLRWGALAAMTVFFALRHRLIAVRHSAAAIAMALVYGTLAQAVPPTLLPLIAPLLMLALAALVLRRDGSGLVAGTMPAFGMGGLIAGLWAIAPFTAWLEAATISLVGRPVEAASLPSTGVTLRQLALPATLINVSLWLLRYRIKPMVATIATVTLAVVGVIALHILYRHGFAALAGDDFIATGMAERALWAALLLGAAVALWRFGQGFNRAAARIALGLAATATLYLVYYSLLLHNPMVDQQAVGAIPLTNMLIPTWALLFGGLWLTERLAMPMLRAPWDARVARGLDMVRAVAIILFSYATLAQAFHGSEFAYAPVGEAENILRSIIAIALAIGFLLWGIRKQARDWRIASLLLMLVAVGKVFLFDASGLTGLIRIASFVALGFSLIGIGWLYSRQLRSDSKPAAPGQA